MPLGLRCPSCAKAMRVPDDSYGRRVECPFCDHVFRFTGQKEVLLGRVPEKPASRSVPMAAPIAAKVVGGAAAGVATVAAVASLARPAKPEVIDLNDLPSRRPPGDDGSVPEVVGQTQPREAPRAETIRPVDFLKDQEAVHVADEVLEAAEAFDEAEVVEAELAETEGASGASEVVEEAFFAEAVEADLAEAAEADLAEAEVAEPADAEIAEAEIAEAEIAEAEIAEADIADAELAEEEEAEVALAEAVEADEAEPLEASLAEAEIAEAEDAPAAEIAEAVEADLAGEADLAAAEAELAAAVEEDLAAEAEEDALLEAAIAEAEEAEEVPEGNVILEAKEEATPAAAADGDLEIAEAALADEGPVAAPPAELAGLTEEEEALAVLAEADEPEAEPADANAAESPVAEGEAIPAEEARELFDDLVEPPPPPSTESTAVSGLPNLEIDRLEEEHFEEVAVFEDGPPAVDAFPLAEESEEEELVVAEEPAPAPPPKKKAVPPAPKGDDDVDLDAIFADAEEEAPIAEESLGDAPTEAMEPSDANELFRDESEEDEPKPSSRPGVKGGKGAKEDEGGKKKGWKLW